MWPSREVRNAPVYDLCLSHHAPPAVHYPEMNIHELQEVDEDSVLSECEPGAGGEVQKASLDSSLSKRDTSLVVPDTKAM